MSDKENKENIDKMNKALIEASLNGHLDVVNRLLDCKEIEVNAQSYIGWTALFWASQNGHLDVVNRLLYYNKIQVNLQNKYGDTALMQASANGHLNVVNRLLDCKQIDTNLQDKYGKTALDHASRVNGNLSVVNRLTEFTEFQKEQIREGVELSYFYYSLYIPDDLVELITKFVV